MTALYGNLSKQWKAQITCLIHTAVNRIAISSVHLLYECPDIRKAKKIVSGSFNSLCSKSQFLCSGKSFGASQWKVITNIHTFDSQPSEVIWNNDQGLSVIFLQFQCECIVKSIFGDTLNYYNFTNQMLLMMVFLGIWWLKHEHLVI